MLASLLERSVHLLGSYLDDAAGDLGITQAEAHVLVALKRDGPLPIGALHREFGHKPSTLTNVVDRLERRELVRRESNPDDRRSVLIRLTESGGHAADRVFATLARLEDQVRAAVAARDIEGVENVARAIAAAVHQLERE